MKILLIGASSYIGKNLKTRLESIAGLEVISIYRNNPDETADINLDSTGWSNKINISEVDILVYLAQSRFYREFPEKVSDIISINIDSVIEAADWGRRNNIGRFIFLSTGNVYGSPNTISKETDFCNPQSMYGASKLSAEVLLKPFSEFFEICVLRLFGTYGPHQADNLIPNVINKFIRNEQITLDSDIGIECNPLYIDDLTSILADFIQIRQENRYDIFNVGSGTTVTLKKIVEQLEIIGGKKAFIKITPRRPAILVGDTSKINKHLNIIEKTDLFKGLSNTYNQIEKEASAGLNK